MTRAEEVHRDLRAALLAGAFPYGERLVEEQLAERFHTSRTPVREALRRLEGDRHLVRDRSGGVRPNPPRVSAMRELYAVRIVLEELAVRTAAADRLDDLRTEWQELRLEHADARPAGRRRLEYPPEGDTPAWVLELGPDFVFADEAFHEGIARASGNQATERYLRDVNERIRVIRVHDFTTPDRIETTIGEHLEILDALCAERRDTAAALMRVHVERSAAVVERRVGELLARMFDEKGPV